MTKSSTSLIPHGDRTVAKICGEKWPRVLSVRMASAYAGLISGDRFKAIPELAALIKKPFGKDAEYVDRHELNRAITALFKAGDK